MMKLKKIYSILLVIGILFVVACGDDNELVYRRYISSELKNYGMYIGTGTGAAEIGDLDSIKTKFEKMFPDSIFESYTSMTISFIDDEIVIDPQRSGTLPEISRYQLIDSSFYILKGEDQVYLGDGDYKEIKIRRHFVGYKRSDDTKYHYVRVAPQKDIDEAIAAGQTPFQSVDQVVNEGDTLIWCTRVALFQ